MDFAKWRVKGIYKADATKCAMEINDIGEEATAEQVLDKARSSDTELHKCFDWDVLWLVKNGDFSKQDTY